METEQLGKSIGEKLQTGTVIALSGPLGSGKTTFAKGLARGMGIEATVTSPSFTLINEYPGNIPLVHIDVFRLDSLEEFEMIGGEDLLYEQAVTIIEWSEKIAPLLPDNTVSVDIGIENNGRRSFRITGFVP